MAGRRGTAPTKNGPKPPLPPPPPAKHEKTPQLPSYQIKMFKVHAFAIFKLFSRSPLVKGEEGACDKNIKIFAPLSNKPQNVLCKPS